MKTSKSAKETCHKIPSYIISRHDAEGCVAINLNTLKQYHFEGVSAEIFDKIRQEIPTNKILESLAKKSESSQELVEKEYKRMIEFLLSKQLIE